MNLFSDWEGDVPHDDWDDTAGRRMADRDAEWSGSYPDGHSKSPYKDDGDMKLFKND